MISTFFSLFKPKKALSDNKLTGLFDRETDIWISESSYFYEKLLFNY